MFWLHLLHQPLEGMNPVVRELPGLVLLFAYLFLLPPLLATTVLRASSSRWASSASWCW